jgi:transcriptional regulator with XRE-family HTH domain
MSSNDSRIRKLRKERKLSGIEVSQKLGITPQYYYDIEKGERRLTTEIADRLADIFKVTVDYLLGKTEVNLYGNTKSSDPHEESELSEIPIEKLNTYNLTYKGHKLSKEDGAAIAEMLEAALKRWKQ